MLITVIKHSAFLGSKVDFVVKDNFYVRSQPINIHYVGENIRDFFWGKVIGPMSAYHIFAYKLGKNTSTSDLINHFGGGDGSSLVVAWNLLLDQPYGQGGYLDTEGRTNIFLGLDYSIGVFWYKNGWSIRAYPANAKRERIWYAENQVIILK